MEPLSGSRSIWLLLFASGLGIACLGFALLLFVETLGMAERQGYGGEITKGFTAATVFAVLGVCWACSSLLYWMKRQKVANVVNLGTLASAGLFLVLVKLGVVL